MSTAAGLNTSVYCMLMLMLIAWLWICNIEPTVVKTKMSLKIGGGGESFLAYLASVRLFTGVHQIMLLQVSQLSEA